MKIEDALNFASKSVECEQALKKDFEFCGTCPDKAYCPLSDELDGEEYYKVISASLEKQIPKEPVVKPYGYFCAVCDDPVGIDGEENHYRQTYCENCGQAQKWSGGLK